MVVVKKAFGKTVSFVLFLFVYNFRFCLCTRNEYVILAAQYKPLNLGQGFPDFAAPKYATDALGEVAKSDNVLLHQYTRGFVSC